MADQGIATVIAAALAGCTGILVWLTARQRARVGPGWADRVPSIRLDRFSIGVGLLSFCLIALVSDLYIDPEDFRTALARIKHKRHDVLVFQTIDQRERAFDLRDVAPFEGLEGEPKLKVDPRAIRTAYQAVYEEHLAAIERITRSFGFDYQLVNTHDWLGPPMAAFLAKRNAQIKRSKFG